MRMKAEVRKTNNEVKAQKGGSLRLVFDFWRQRPGWSVALVVGTIVVTAISMVFPYLLRMIIDGIKRGITQPELVKIRTGSWAAMCIIGDLSRGWMLADLVAIIGSLDVIAPEIDR